MENPRKSGILLMLGAVLVFVGINYELAPPDLIWSGLLMAPLGLLLFMKGNREVLEAAERRAAKISNPTIRSVTADAFADRQAAQIAERGAVDNQLRAPQPPPTRPNDEVALVEEPASAPMADDGNSDDQFQISSDVSFPVEVQERTLLADEIRKLQWLRDDGIIDEQEFAAAKAKLLD